MKNSFKNTFPLEKKGFFKKKLLFPNFKNFDKALNKRMLFPLDRKSVSTSQNEEFVKIYAST